MNPAATFAAAMLALMTGATALMATAETTPPAAPASDPAPTAAPAPEGLDRAAWVAVAGKADQSEPRFDMIDAAIAQVTAGATQDEVLDRLGEPDQRFDGAWAYMAGPTLFGGEYTAVLVRFDAAGRVIDARRVSSETWQ